MPAHERLKTDVTTVNTDGSSGAGSGLAPGEGPAVQGTAIEPDNNTTASASASQIDSAQNSGAGSTGPRTSLTNDPNQIWGLTGSLNGGGNRVTGASSTGVGFAGPHDPQLAHGIPGLLSTGAFSADNNAASGSLGDLDYFVPNFLTSPVDGNSSGAQSSGASDGYGRTVFRYGTDSVVSATGASNLYTGGTGYTYAGKEAHGNAVSGAKNRSLLGQSVYPDSALLGASGYTSFGIDASATGAARRVIEHEDPWDGLAAIGTYTTGVTGAAQKLTITASTVTGSVWAIVDNGGRVTDFFGGAGVVITGSVGQTLALGASGDSTGAAVVLAELNRALGEYSKQTGKYAGIVSAVTGSTGPVFILTANMASTGSMASWQVRNYTNATSGAASGTTYITGAAALSAITGANAFQYASGSLAYTADVEGAAYVFTFVPQGDPRVRAQKPVAVNDTASPVLTPATLLHGVVYNVFMQPVLTGTNGPRQGYTVVGTIAP